MTQFQKGALEGFGFVIGAVCVVGAGIALCIGAIGLVVRMSNWLLGLLHMGGCA